MKTVIAFIFFIAAFVLIAWYFPCEKLPDSWCNGLPWCESGEEASICEHVKNT
ncbi:hypothetical protein HON52_00845 [Candidatus Uhrbacteria bacterium]|nr:hypothetical protein [Candidatus Uhrbacteria bacterium]